MSRYRGAIGPLGKRGFKADVMIDVGNELAEAKWRTSVGLGAMLKPGMILMIADMDRDGLILFTRATGERRWLEGGL